ncbi:Small ribosomal subunit protein mS35 [Nakaseomyces bracarensis]|uniref:Small ribosomal subunit protein mS35 n=1 Tax=Nakaseomyces bracarensis TaxID=273131 RepID=A0ABR4NSZ4_9SACH
MFKLPVCRVLQRGLKTQAQTTPVASNLYMEPSKWKGLPSEQIISLYWERMAKLGKKYKQQPEELEALLTTSEYTGVPESHIRKLYKYGEKGMLEIGGGASVSGGNAKDKVGGFSRFQFDELPSQALDLVAQHREQRFYNRLAAYELPLLAQYRQEYRRPDPVKYPVTYKYMTYIGEEHPNSRKVVMTFKTAELGLGERELHKFRLLAKTRYDYTKDEFRMSSDRYPEPQQNAKYLSDTLHKLLKEAKDLSKDDFSDVPLDKRHIIARNLRKKQSMRLKNIQFPESWKRPEDAPVPKANIVEEMKRYL